MSKGVGVLAGPADPLTQLTEARRALDRAQQQVQDGVTAARAAGHSWAEIGTALGVTRQAAFKRFGAPRDPRTGRTMTPVNTATEVRTLAERVFRLLDDDDITTLTRLMTLDTAQVLTPQVLRETWARAVAENGRLVEVRGTTVHLPDGSVLPDGERALGMVVARCELVCDAGSWAGRVAVDLDGGVVGMLVAAPGETDLPF